MDLHLRGIDGRTENPRRVSWSIMATKALLTIDEYEQLPDTGVLFLKWGSRVGNGQPSLGLTVIAGNRRIRDPYVRWPWNGGAVRLFPIPIGRPKAHL